MSIVIVQTTPVPNSGNGFAQSFTSLTATLSGVTSGNALLAQSGISNGTGVGVALTVTDTTTSTSMGVDYVETGDAMSCQFNSLYGVASGTHAINFSNGTWTAANAAGGCLVSECSGMLTNGFDKGAFADGHSVGPLTTVSTGTLTNQNEIYFAVATGFDLVGCLTTPTGGPGTFTTLAHSYTNFGDWCLAQQIAPSSTTGVTVTFGTSNTSQKWMAAVATYQGSVGGYSLSASYGPFSIAGQAATLSANTSIPDLLAACGTYNISLASASSDFDLISAFGSYAYVGIAASLVPVYSAQSLIAAFGSYSIAAQNALLVFAQPQPAPSGLNIIPPMVGIFYEEAVYLLEQLNIYSPPTILSISQTPTVIVNFIASNQIPGIVLAQSLAVGAPAPLGTPVTLTVSQYPMAQDVRP